MIISVNPRPTLSDFSSLMERTDTLLNSDALKRPTYYASRGGSPLEDDIVSALNECAKGTVFENTIEKVSGQRFPDIVAARFYGVEVKSTKNDHWTSTGSSILETTRIQDIERIFMTFGKLGGRPIQFLSRPYEACLSDIAVTHMPRYRIDMRLKAGETIFDKMGVPYDKLRMMDNPIEPVSKYYRSQLKEGESLWWAGDTGEETVSATIRLWKRVSIPEKRRYTIYGCVNFPEVFAGNYDRYSLWLTSQGVVDSHIRDQFSAGGQTKILMPNGCIEKFPAVYGRVKNNIDLFLELMSYQDSTVLYDTPVLDIKTLSKRLMIWSNQVSKISKIDYEMSMSALKTMFWKQCGGNFSW